jgi:hypothetical protein
MKRLLIGSVAVAIGSAWLIPGPGLCLAATEPPTMQSGGGQSPSTGGRPDQQDSQLGTGNRGSGQRGSDGTSSLDPGKVRSAPVEAGRIVGQVLAIEKDIYIVRKPDGHEVTLKADNRTDLQSTINMGETVEAQVDSSGRLKQLKPINSK